MKDKHSLKPFTHWGLKLYLMQFLIWGLCSLCSWSVGSRGCAPAELNQGTKEWRSPSSTTSTPNEPPLSSNTGFPTCNLGEQDQLWSPFTQSGMREVARRVSLHQNPPFVPSLPAQSVGFSPGTSAAPALQRHPETHSRKKRRFFTLDLFPS